MTEFSKFFFEKQEPEKSVPLIEQSTAALSSSLVGHLAAIGIPSVQALSNEQKSQFANKASETAHSKEFIDELSKEIGIPAKNETEDEFVMRSKILMKSLLNRRLFKA